MTEQDITKEKDTIAVDKPRRPRKATKAQEGETVPEITQAAPEGHSDLPTEVSGPTAVLADLSITQAPQTDDTPKSVITYPDGITVIHH